MTHLLFSSTALLIVSSLILIGLAPVDSALGISQKIFYFHVPSAWAAALAFLINFIGSLRYLIKRDLRWDRIASSSAEIGVVFGAITLITGSIWARFAWGIWWTWDVRLTATLILWLAYMGYMLVRMISEDEKKRIFSAVIGIAAFANVPLVFLSIRWWRSIHPAVITRRGLHLDTTMKVTFFVSLVAMTLFYLCLLKLRVKVERLKDDVEVLRNG
jgi:heme exporter protein C